MKLDITDSEEFREIVRRSRARELHELTRRLYSGAVVVYGEAGMGKTTLLEMFRAENPGAYRKITLLRGYDIELDKSLLVPYILPGGMRPTAFPELIIIDGLDEVLTPALREQVADIVREGWTRGYKVILSARKQPDEKVFDQYTSSINLRGLNEKEILLLYEMFRRHSNKHPDLDMTVRDLVLADYNKPRDILTQFNFLLDDEGEYLYRNPVIIEELERPTIILEEAPEIITDLRFVNKKLLDRIGRRPEAIRDLSPRQFEELVAEIYEERGYSVQLTQQTRDGGKDLIIMHRSDIGNFMIYAECKHRAPDRPVGVGVVSELFGRINFDRATAGMVVTSSYFSPDAKVFQSKIEHQMSLVDYAKLSSMMGRS
ncbi:restriction endonuclease [Mucilaginibacter sp. UR6-11]|uniref:restriction endonuclease n=1 Tax=Mucilaginibacter sp. UR6-11 TaxID=1435644 RepID=UPI001E2C63D7|nr:restriction endonuclease [Mucilaginibacter sp. UR6-11]MCC8423573.1 restriction endonuclease [Mucilaginibacter sp. UR6-11]